MFTIRTRPRPSTCESECARPGAASRRRRLPMVRLDTRQEKRQALERDGQTTFLSFTSGGTFNVPGEKLRSPERRPARPC